MTSHLSICMEFISLPHSIYSKDPNGRILAEITFPEHAAGQYCIERTYTAEEYIGTDLPGELVEMAVRQIRSAGGKVTAECPFASKYLKDHRL